MNTTQAVVQNSDDKPKLSRRTATGSQTPPVCNKGITQFLPATHTRTIVSTPKSQGNRPLTGTN